MSALDTVAKTAELVGGIATDVSKWIPAPGGTIASLIGLGAKAIAYVVHVVENHPNPSDPVSVLETALKLASDAEMQAELGP